MSQTTQRTCENTYCVNASVQIHLEIESRATTNRKNNTRILYEPDNELLTEFYKALDSGETIQISHTQRPDLINSIPKRMYTKGMHSQPGVKLVLRVKQETFSTIDINGTQHVYFLVEMM